MPYNTPITHQDQGRTCSLHPPSIHLHWGYFILSPAPYIKIGARLLRTPPPMAGSGLPHPHPLVSRSGLQLPDPLSSGIRAGLCPSHTHKAGSNPFCTNAVCCIKPSSLIWPAEGTCTTYPALGHPKKLGTTGIKNSEKWLIVRNEGC